MSEPKSVRWRRRKGERPAEILSAALDCFTERGFAATRLDDVAKRAGVTKGTLYLYFPSKEHLFKAVVRESLIPNIERLEAAAAEATVSAFLQSLATIWVGSIANSRISGIPKLVIAEAGNFPELARFYLDEVVHRALRLLTNLLRRGVESGEIRPIDVDHTVYCVIAPLIFTLLWQHSLGPFDDRPFDAGAVVRAHIDLLLRGLLVGPKSNGRPKKNKRGTRERS